METNNFGIGFRKSRKDKGLKRKEYAKKTAISAVKVASRVLTGAALLGGGLYLNKKLGQKAFFPDLTRGRTVRRIAAKSRANSENALAVALPAASLGGITIGADYLIDRKNDMPITRKTRKIINGSFSTPNPNYKFSGYSTETSEFKETKSTIRSRLKNVGKVMLATGVGTLAGAASLTPKGKKKKPYSFSENAEISEFAGKKGRSGRKKKGIISTSNSKNPLSWNRKLSLGGHVAKGAAIGAATEGGLSALAASPVPVLIPAATVVGATSGAIKGSVLGAATYGVREGIRKGKKKKK